MKLLVRTETNQIQHWQTDSTSFKEAAQLIKEAEPTAKIILALVEPNNAYDL